MQSGTQVPAGTRSCVSCGRSIAWDVNVCPYCGHDYRMQMMPAQRMQARAGYAGWAGGLIIASGVLGLIMGILLMLVSTLSSTTLNANLPSGFTEQDLRNVLAVMGAMFTIFGIVAIIGGVFAYERKHFAVAVLGAIFGIISIGFFVGAVLAVIGLILEVVSRHEFDQAVPPPPT